MRFAHALAPAALILLGCATGPAANPPATSGRLAEDEGPACVSDASAPPRAGARAPSAAPPSLVPPNASRVVADVLERSVWAPATLPVPPLPSNPDRQVFSLTLSIASSTAYAPEYENLAVPGSRVEAFSCTAMPPGLAGQRIEAVLTLAGDSRGTRWWVSRVRVLP